VNALFERKCSGVSLKPEKCANILISHTLSQQTMGMAIWGMQDLPAQANKAIIV